VNELAIMRKLSKDPHRNLLQMEGVFESDNSIYVILELLAGGQLFHRIRERNGVFTSA
jgi:serine/threonine protein kinase